MLNETFWMIFKHRELLIFRYRSSVRVSPISSAFISGKTSPNCGSPKSPPNTPNPELESTSSLHEELKAVYINHFVRPDEVHGELTASDIMWDWSSKPNIPCKYVFKHYKKWGKLKKKWTKNHEKKNLVKKGEKIKRIQGVPTSLGYAKWNVLKFQRVCERSELHLQNIDPVKRGKFWISTQ